METQKWQKVSREEKEACSFRVGFHSVIGFILYPSAGISPRALVSDTNVSQVLVP